MGQLDAKSLFAICMLEGETVPCVWSPTEYKWRDFQEVKFLNDNYLLFSTKENTSIYPCRYFIFSIKENLLVDGFHRNTALAEILHDIKQFEKAPRTYGR
jgi:hypothetical protein